MVRGRFVCAVGEGPVESSRLSRSTGRDSRVELSHKPKMHWHGTFVFPCAVLMRHEMKHERERFSKNVFENNARLRTARSAGRERRVHAGMHLRIILVFVRIESNRFERVFDDFCI